jgi:geranylgeranyl pyrophosphate synthase
VVLIEYANNHSSEHMFDYLVTLLGQYFQIRDDYQNLMADEVSVDGIV